MKLFRSASSALLFVLIVGLAWSQQLENEDAEETSDLETAESAFHIDPKTVILTGLAGIGGLVVTGVGLGKLLLLAKAGSSFGNSHSHSSSSSWDSSSSSYSHPSYPSYKSYSSSHSSDEPKSTSYSGSLKVTGSLSPVH
ncbi:uncharacterized protein LOC118463587 isoform X2 [Anopheles albimanus]|uniref:uncharacterized protein LOC118463587 isoform X2 n=1 Tax=Anopheles albimanus TaxID=7167 RepID=UPI0016416FDE|nr:uncharacterized protein LOC118463587 isoform X2 [Anopheles albimanus]